MTTENIVVKIDDSVSPAISSKLKEIANDARTANTSITGLQASLGKLNVSKITASAQAQNNSAIASAKLATAQNNQAASAVRLQTAQAQLAATQGQGATQAANLAAAQANLAASQSNAARAALLLAQAQQRQNQSTKQSTQNFNAAGISVKQYNAAMRGVPAQITDIVVSLQGGQRPLTVLLQQGGQLKDMFGGIVPAVKALTAGLIAMISPITVAIAAFAGFAAIVATVESRMREINGLIAQFSATGRGSIDGTFIVQLRKELMLLPGVSRSVATDVIKAFADVRSVGGDQLKQATALSVDLATAMGTDIPTASAKLAKALDDPKKGILDLDRELGSFTVQQMKAVKAFTDQGKTAQAQKVILDSLSASIKGLTYESLTPMQKAQNDLANAWNRFTGELSNSGPVKTATDAIIGLLKGLTELINKLNQLFSLSPPQWMKDAAQGAYDVATQVSNPVGSILSTGLNLLGSKSPTGSAITGNANIAARTGAQYAMGTDKKATLSGLKKDGDASKAESRAAALAKVNKELENELKLMGMLGPEREAQQMYDRIEESFIGRKIKLTKDEISAIQERIAAIVSNKDQQSEMNRIYSEAVQPGLTYIAVQKAADDLLARGIITLGQHNQQMVKAFEAQANLVDPTRAYNIELDQQLALAKTRGDQSEIMSKMQQLENSLLREGIVLRGDELQKIRERLIANQAAVTQQQAENSLLANTVEKRKEFINQIKAIKALTADPNSGFGAGDAANTTSGLLGNMGIDTSQMEVGKEAMLQVYNDLYAQINLLREADLIKEADYQSAKAQLAAKQTSEQLKGASTFFGQLATMQSSNVKELSRIGKAAAIAQAVINTYEGATKALAQGGIYGSVMAAAVVASGMAQVAQIRSQGFQSGGYTGNGGVSDVAGVVHGQEFVVNAAGTQKYRGLLETINNGGSVQSAATVGSAIGGRGNNLNVNVNNQIAGAQFEVNQITPNEVEIIARRVARKEADKGVAASFNNPNSAGFKAMQRTTTVERNF